MSDNEQEKQTLVEEGTEFSGTLRAKCKVVVRGAVEGELDAPSVDIADTGTVTGILRATSVRSQGTLAGIVEVDDISVAGTVQSDTVIRAKTLEVKLGAAEGRLEVTFGDCVLEVGDMPGDQPTDDDRITTDNASDEAAESLQAGGDADHEDGKKSRKRRNRNRKNRGKAPDGALASSEGDDEGAEEAEFADTDGAPGSEDSPPGESAGSEPAPTQL